MDVFVCCDGTFWQHLRSCQDGYRFMTVHTHDDFMVMKTMLTIPCSIIPLSHPDTEQTSPCPIPVMLIGSNICKLC